MNLRCKVCGEKAAGFHFGAFTCEGCKSFFGRCCNNMSIIGECRNNKECVINKKNRTSCKACRLQKCLQVGMSKSGSRYGRRSNWFKQYFQETEHTPHAQDKCSLSPPSSLHDSESEQRYPSPDQLKYLDKTAYSGVSVAAADADTVEEHKKIQLPFDLDSAATQPLISSHLYLNCFPTLGLNRFVSYKQAASALAYAGQNTATAAFFLPPNVSFSRLFPGGGGGAAEKANVDEYFEKLFVARYDRDDEYDRRISDTMARDNPLDLSSKPRRLKEQAALRHSSQHYETELSKKVLPLDLSVK